MAHYAFLDENNVVTEVIVGQDEDNTFYNIFDWEEYYSEVRGQKCKRTSYNGNIRKNFAGIGYTYIEEIDAFVPPKPFNSWVLDEEKAVWKAPIDRPDNDSLYIWNEESLLWEIPLNSPIPTETPITFDN